MDTFKGKSDTVNTVKIKSKINLWIRKRGMENCKMSGENAGKFREFCSEGKMATL